LSYEVTFQVKQAVLGDYFSLKVNLYNRDEVLLTDCPVSAISGSQTNTAINVKSLLQNDEYYFVRLILFNENISTDAANILDIGFGNHLILNNSNAKYMSIELGAEIANGGAWDGANDLRIYDFKVRPLMSPIPNSFVMVSNIITSFMDNNSEQTNKVTENTIKRYLVPYNSILKNQFLDELFVSEGTPLRIIVSFTDETILSSNNGTITITAVGGVSPYQYSIDNGSTFQSTGTFTNLSPATYNILVEDAEAVQVTDTVVIAQGVTNLDFEAFPVSSSKLDVADGQITILASGGVSPYFYSRNGVDFFVGNIFIGLLAGDYTIYVRDTDLSETDKPVVVGSVRNRTVIFTVVDELVSPVGTVNIAVISENYLTNGSGNATIYLEDGSYEFTLTKAGYRTVDLTGVAITEDRAIPVTIQTYYQIIFTVEDSGGTGLSDATIQTTSTPATQDSFTVQTPGGSGVVTKTDIIAGAYSFLVSRDGYEPETANITITGDDSLTIVMSQVLYTLDVNVKGIIFGESSVNLVNATTRVGAVIDTTDSNGNSSLELPAGAHTLVVYKDGYETILYPVTLIGDTSRNITLREAVDAEIRLTSSTIERYCVIPRIS